MIYVFGKILLQSPASEYVTKNVIADLVACGETVRAIWRDEFVFDPRMVDPAFAHIMTEVGSVDPKPPDSCIKTGTIEEVLLDGVDIGAPTDAVLSKLPETLPPTARFGLSRFGTVYATTVEDEIRLKELGLRNVELWEIPYIPPVRPAAIVPRQETWLGKIWGGLRRWLRSLWRRMI